MLRPARAADRSHARPPPRGARRSLRPARPLLRPSRPPLRPARASARHRYSPLLATGPATRLCSTPVGSALSHDHPALLAPASPVCSFELPNWRKVAAGRYHLWQLSCGFPQATGPPPLRVSTLTMESLLEKPLNPNKLLKEQFVSNLTGSSLLEIAALSTIVPALVVLRKWSSRDNPRRDSAKKKDDVHPVRKDWVHYFSTLVVDYLTVVLPILLVFTVLAEWAYTFAVSLVILISVYITFKRSKSHFKAGLNKSSSLRTDVSSYRVSVVLVTCLCILAVDFKIFPRRYAKAETYGNGIMDLGVGSFVVANALVSRQARNITSMSFKAALSSISPLVFLGFARMISTSGVDYQVHVGEYGVHWNFFFTLAAISILTAIVRIHPKHCGLVGLLVLVGYQIWLSFGLNEYLISDERSADLISQNKEGIYSILGYWGMFLIGVSLGYNLFADANSKGKSRNTQLVKVWVLAVSFWILAIVLDSYVERVSRRMCNFAYVMLVFAQNFQVLAILTLAGLISNEKNLVLEDAFNQNMLGSFLLANILTGLVNLSVDTLSASSPTAFIILLVYSFTLCLVAGLAHFYAVRMKFW